MAILCQNTGNAPSANLHLCTVWGLREAFNQDVVFLRVLMADVSEDMDTENLKSLTFLLRGTLPKHKLENVQV